MLSVWFPLPADNGARLRVFHLVRGLAARFEVDFVALVDEALRPGAREALRESWGEGRGSLGLVEVVGRPPFRPRSPRALAAFLRSAPRAVNATFSAEMQEVVDRLVAERDYSVVISEEVHVARYVRSLAHLPRVLEQVELAPLFEAYDRAPSLPLRIRRGLTWWKVSRYHRELLSSFSGSTVVSEQERRHVVALVADADVRVVPNGVDLEKNAFAFATPEPDTMVYAGAPTFVFNREAVRWFAREVLPLVRRDRPDARLRVTGSFDGVPRSELPTGAGLEYTGYLVDPRPAIAGASVSVVPLRRGGGSRMKILESLALGTPVVATTKGAEGLDLVPGRELLVADGPRALADAVLSVFTDDRLRADLVANGRKAVEERYGWGPIVESFVDFVESRALGNAD